MIRAECFLFATMFVTGAIAGTVAALLLLVGKGSRIARAVFDLLAPASVGAFFFFGMQFFAEGVFRLYELVAFASGIFCAHRILRRISPAARRLLRKVILPIKSLAYALEDRVTARLAPRREKRREAKEKRVAVRREKCAAREKTRRIRREEKRKARLSRLESFEVQEGAFPPVIFDRRQSRKDHKDRKGEKGTEPT